MQVILLKDISKVGQRGSVVTVKDGYAQNVLIPKGMALPATDVNLKKHEKAVQGAKDQKAFEGALLKKALDEIDGKTVTIHAKANASGTLFESIQAKHISKAVKDAYGVDLHESAFHLNEPIKKAGEREIRISVGENSAKLMLSVSE